MREGSVIPSVVPLQPAELGHTAHTPPTFTIMAEESMDNLGQATQEEGVPAIIGPSEITIGQGQEAAEALPLAETVPSVIIDEDGFGIEPIDNLSLPDMGVEEMGIVLDEAPPMDADFQIAEANPEGDGSSIGNIAPLHEDVPLHAEEGMGNLGQATQEEGVPAIIGPSEESIGQEQESAEALPLAETVPSVIIDEDGFNVPSIDNFDVDLNGGDIISAMENQFGEAPHMTADFSIAPMQPEGDGSSIGNIAPMNPDAPLHAEEFGSEETEGWRKALYGMTEEDTIGCYGCERTIGIGEDVYINDEVAYGQMCGDCYTDGRYFDAEDFSAEPSIEPVPPAVCFVEKIPPEVWANTTLEEKLEYADTGNEDLLGCPQCGITKKDMRDNSGYCPTN